MADGWLPPSAPGAKPPPRFDAPAGETAPPQRPAYAPPAHPAGQQQPAPASGPTFVRPQRAAAGKQNRAAVWAITLGITGLTLLLVSLGTLFVLTLPLSLAAVVMARKARAQIDEGKTTNGANQANAALWLGRIGVIAGVAAMVVFIALLLAGVDFDALREDLQRELDEQRERNRDDGPNGVRTAVEQLRAAAGAWLAR